MSFVDLSGMKFGILTVVKRTDDHVASSGRKYPQYLCNCECGNSCIALAQCLTAGRKTNCGCLTKKLKSEAVTRKNTTHGDAHRLGKRNRLYALWIGIKRRCYNKNDPSYQRYGGKGIKMCDEWKNNYPSFRDWAISNGYDFDAPRGMCTIDRIDCTKDYCPDNCRFVSNEVQGDNRSCVAHVEYNGEIHNLNQWSKITGIKAGTLRLRYRKGIRGDDLFYKGRLPNREKQ